MRRLVCSLFVLAAVVVGPRPSIAGQDIPARASYNILKSTDLYVGDLEVSSGTATVLVATFAVLGHPYLSTRDRDLTFVFIDNRAGVGDITCSNRADMTPTGATSGTVVPSGIATLFTKKPRDTFACVAVGGAPVSIGMRKGK